MEKEMQKSPIPLPVAIVLAATMISATMFFNARIKASQIISSTSTETQTSAEEEAVLPSQGVMLPVVWGDLGQKLVSAGVIDKNKFIALYQDRGQQNNELDLLINGGSVDKLKISRENSGYVLNLLWALGLASKNPILTEGEMSYPAYGGADRFASTAGWTIAVGSPMDHYNRHKFFNLTETQQTLVDKISRNIYRPCCNNSTHFPDCNHGMAMLGLLELMASQGVSEEEMYKAALAVNSYWFPETYLTISSYMRAKGVEWKEVNPEEILGADYSSASGYGRVVSEIPTRSGSGSGLGSGCSVGGSAAPQGGSGCSI